MKTYLTLPGHPRPAIAALTASAALVALVATSAAGAALAQPAMGPATSGSPRMGSVPEPRLADEVKVPVAEIEAPNKGPAVQGEVVPGRLPCPHPVVRTLNVVGSTRNPADFPASWNGHYASGLNDMSPNKIFGYTFQAKWPSERVCCEVVGAVLTFKVECHADIPQNDGWTIMHNGAGVYGAGGAIGWPAGCRGQTKTIIWTATPAVVAIMNANAAGPSLSFEVEDDTAVTSASLQISECCVLRHSVRPSGM